MVKERAQKKSFKESLEDIKEKMKEKRNKRLASASAPRRGRTRVVNKSSGSNSTHNILKGIQVNNKELAVALQGEKDKVRHANAVILQLKREQQALFLHLLLLKRKLKDQEAQIASASETKKTNIPVGPQPTPNSTRRKQTSQNRDEPTVCEAAPKTAEPQTTEKKRRSDCEKQVALPSTVGVRRRPTDKRTRRSERVREQSSLSEGNHMAGAEALTASPIHRDGLDPNLGPGPETADPMDTEEFQNSTPEPVPTTKKPNRKQAQQQGRTKTEPAPRKPERSRRPERAPLKKPWENSKPRARSKSRDRSATRSKNAPPAPGNKLNTSLGFNDTFDFDCEEAVHLTPFKAKAEDAQLAAAIQEEAPQRGRALTGGTPAASKHKSSATPPSSSSESEDSLYVPQKNKKNQNRASPRETKAVPTRRSRRSKVLKPREGAPPKREITVFRDEESDPAKKDSIFSNSPNTVDMEQENHPAPHSEDMQEDYLPSVSPLVEAEMMRIDNVLSNFGDSSCEPSPLLPQEMPQRIKPCKKRGLGVRTAGRGLSLCDVTNMSPAAYRKYSCDARCSTPVPARKRRCTVVDYKEPSINGKLRRGDKFTDLQFLRSPIFKQKPDRRSVQKSRISLRGQPPFEKYNESFVGATLF